LLEETDAHNTYYTYRLMYPVIVQTPCSF